MKKLISGFLTVIMITCFISITAFAENVVVECKKTELKETNQIKVEAIISENAGINTAAMNVVYDNKALEISQKEDEGVIQGDYVSQGGIFIGNPKADENKVSVTYASVTQTKKKAALFSVVFNVLDQSAINKDSIKLEVTEMFNIDEKAISYTVKDANEAGTAGGLNNSTNDFLIIILSIVGGLIIIGAVVISIIIIKKKNKKDIKAE
ncbi:MAG: hypothetical protein RR549_02925 [Oscillospiraceae bacterium]